MAFADAGIDPSEVGYINAHGTSTPLGDASETRVIKLAVGEENAARIPVSSTKGATGHCLGAAGAIEAIFTILATERGVLPPTINYEDPDPECDLDYIPNEARESEIQVGVSNSFGFGGHNACVVFRKHDGVSAAASGRRRGGAAPLPRSGATGGATAHLGTRPGRARRDVRTDESFSTRAADRVADTTVAVDRAARSPASSWSSATRPSRCYVVVAATAARASPMRCSPRPSGRCARTARASPG